MSLNHLISTPCRGIAAPSLVCRRARIQRPVARREGRPSDLGDQAFDALQEIHLQGYRFRISLASRAPYLGQSNVARGELTVFTNNIIYIQSQLFGMLVQHVSVSGFEDRLKAFSLFHILGQVLPVE